MSGEQGGSGGTLPENQLMDSMVTTPQVEQIRQDTDLAVAALRQAAAESLKQQNG